MIVLDTNVISEMMKQPSDIHVREWLNDQNIDTLYTTAITVAELRAGIEFLPNGKRKDDLFSRLSLTIDLFSDHIVLFDTAAAITFGRIMAFARHNGRALGFQDGLIAAIAANKQASIATRDTSPFEAVGLKIINPWQA